MTVSFDGAIDTFYRLHFFLIVICNFNGCVESASRKITPFYGDFPCQAFDQILANIIRQVDNIIRACLHKLRRCRCFTSALLILRNNNPYFAGLSLLYWRKTTPTLAGYSASSNDRYTLGCIAFSLLRTKDSKRSLIAAARSC